MTDRRGGRLNAVGLLCAVPVLAAPAWRLTGRGRGRLPILGVQLVGQQVARPKGGRRRPTRGALLAGDAAAGAWERRRKAGVA